jgi:hypothetical protein
MAPVRGIGRPPNSQLICTLKKINSRQHGRAPFPKIDRHACFIVKDANGIAVSYVCLESETGRRVAAGRRISKRVSSCMPDSLRLG